MVLNAEHPRNFFFALAIAIIFTSPFFSASLSSTSDIIISIDCSRTDDAIASYAEIIVALCLIVIPKRVLI